jgi:2,4-dienoyl-CoA reductase-like NADH-dependent reductase (Old Yellow Enzyme family)
VDLIDCSSGGNVPDGKVPVGPGYQVPFAERIRHEAGIATATVGKITEPGQAEEIIRSGRADVVLLARAMQRDAYWAAQAQWALGVPNAVTPPVQYTRGWSEAGKRREKRLIFAGQAGRRGGSEVSFAPCRDRRFLSSPRR